MATPNVRALRDRRPSPRPTAIRKAAPRRQSERSALNVATANRAALDLVSSAVMMIDRDFLITYANTTTIGMLRKNAEHFRALWPSFDPERILGTCIDMFHKQPAHQRRMLSDPSKLPHRAEIVVGPLRFNLHVHASFDSAGVYNGNILEWADVTDLRAKELENTQYRAQFAAYKSTLEAIDKAQAVIEFDMDGTIQVANQNFLTILGYSMEEIRGRHHQMFVDPAYRTSVEYAEFWAKLRRGEYDFGQYRRVAKSGKELWIQGSYHPILDASGKPHKVVKYASDVTAQVRLHEHMSQVLKGVTGTAASLKEASSELAAVSQQMSANAEETAAQADAVAGASEAVSTNVQTVAAGTEEMSASIREIARNTADAAKVAREAVSLAETTNATVTQLGESGSEVGNVIKVITAIAGQTKMLALNASIEAARAGEAGKGFAVVANEVKELAKETAKATEDISQKIEAIQADTRSAIDAIVKIGATISRISDIQNTIASAVEEQTATTNEMSRNVMESANGSNEISKNIQGVATAARDTTQGATKSLEAARNLTALAAQLEGLVKP